MARFAPRLSIASAISSLLLLIGAGTWMFHTLEDWTWAESFYFSVATLSTVGYGDVHPTTDETRIISAVYILIGVGIVIAALSTVGSAYLDAQERRLSNNITRRVANRRLRREKRRRKKQKTQ